MKFRVLAELVFRIKPNDMKHVPRDEAVDSPSSRRFPSNTRESELPRLFRPQVLVRWVDTGEALGLSGFAKVEAVSMFGVIHVHKVIECPLPVLDDFFEKCVQKLLRTGREGKARMIWL